MKDSNNLYFLIFVLLVKDYMLANFNALKIANNIWIDFSHFWTVCNFIKAFN